jgi:hypothetical protein
LISVRPVDGRFQLAVARAYAAWRMNRLMPA